MNFTEALEYISSTTRLGSRLGLGRVLELLGLMDNPQKKCKYVHVAGTNGKGSTVMMTASVLQKAGFKTGIYISPHLYRYNERMQIGEAGRDGFNEISDEEFADITSYVKSKIDTMFQPPTEFEILTAVGFEYFARHECDFAVLEVGLGGRLDATNVIDYPECSVIAAIGFDHMAELGHTLESIAWAKAGIIKPGRPTVLYDQDQAVIGIVEEECRKMRSEFHVTDSKSIEPLISGSDGQVFRYKGKGDYAIPLLGAHQLKNASVVLEVIDVLRSRGFAISDEALKDGLRNSFWPGRFEILSRDPYFVVDGGHNTQCAETVVANIKEYFPGQKAVMLIGVLADKEYPEMMDILNETADCFVCVTPDSYRALPAEELAKYLEKFGKPVSYYDTIKDGVEAARKLAAETTGVACAVGSLYMTGDIRACFGKF